MHISRRGTITIESKSSSPPPAAPKADLSTADVATIKQRIDDAHDRIVGLQRIVAQRDEAIQALESRAAEERQLNRNAMTALQNKVRTARSVVAALLP